MLKLYVLYYFCDINFYYFFHLGTPHAKKALAISLSMVSLAYLTSPSTIVAYVTQIFKETGSIKSEKESAVLISITQLTANIVILNIVDRFNRRVCASVYRTKFTLSPLWMSSNASILFFECFRHFTLLHLY